MSETTPGLEETPETLEPVDAFSLLKIMGDLYPDPEKPKRTRKTQQVQDANPQ